MVVRTYVVISHYGNSIVQHVNAESEDEAIGKADAQINAMSTKQFDDALGDMEFIETEVEES